MLHSTRLFNLTIRLSLSSPPLLIDLKKFTLKSSSPRMINDEKLIFPLSLHARSPNPSLMTQSIYHHQVHEPSTLEWYSFRCCVCSGLHRHHSSPINNSLSLRPTAHTALIKSDKRLKFNLKSLDSEAVMSEKSCVSEKENENMWAVCCGLMRI